MSQHVQFEMFVQILRREIMEFRVNQYHIKSKSDVLGLTEVNKTAMTCFDDKAFLLPCGLHNLPYGHYRIKKYEGNPPCDICDCQSLTEATTFSNVSALMSVGKSEVEYSEFNPNRNCLLYTSPSPRDGATSRMPSSA